LIGYWLPPKKPQTTKTKMIVCGARNSAGLDLKMLIPNPDCSKACPSTRIHLSHSSKGVFGKCCFWPTTGRETDGRCITRASGVSPHKCFFALSAHLGHKNTEYSLKHNQHCDLPPAPWPYKSIHRCKRRPGDIYTSITSPHVCTLCMKQHTIFSNSSQVANSHCIPTCRPTIIQ
jgi:hypothetical protein